MDSLSKEELACLRRVAQGRTPLADAGSTLAQLQQRGLIEKRLQQALPLERRSEIYVLTSAGKRALSR